MGSLDQQVARVVAEHVGAADQVEFHDYGAIQGGSETKKEVKRAFWQILTGSSTSAHKAESYLAAAVTPNEIVLLPVAFKTGLTGMSFKAVGEPIRCPRDRTVIRVGEVKTRGRQKSVRVELTLSGGLSRSIDFYDNPERWRSVASR